MGRRDCRNKHICRGNPSPLGLCLTRPYDAQVNMAFLAAIIAPEPPSDFLDRRMGGEVQPLHGDQRDADGYRKVIPPRTPQLRGLPIIR
jgi:hypothetical protein